MIGALKRLVTEVMPVGPMERMVAVSQTLGRVRASEDMQEGIRATRRTAQTGLPRALREQLEMTAVHPDDLAGVTAWFETLAAHVREVDFAGARAIFAADMVAFGTFTDFMTGRDAAERQQWRNVWPHIDGFRCRPDIRAIVSPDRLQAVGMGVFNSTGYRQDGTPYDRPGPRNRRVGASSHGAPWLAQHTHLSLFRDVPTRSFKNKPEKRSTLTTIRNCGRR